MSCRRRTWDAGPRARGPRVRVRVNRVAGNRPAKGMPVLSVARRRRAAGRGLSQKACHCACGPVEACNSANVLCKSAEWSSACGAMLSLVDLHLGNPHCHRSLSQIMLQGADPALVCLPGWPPVQTNCHALAQLCVHHWALFGNDVWEDELPPE
eukprot:69071-Chlamydomonas_euryale.AAC.1